ncbi:hypothetical protein TRIATDRAFT_302204 [Trichoderma atroviride IMI 206040]|uniref:Uncharacterized protein n=1 Tax=Hypocrea atroviridis (strain ATCC 20476 / IMI 206040) TaxID=452589 RepID=G9P8U3_HYPAI|nr:uncharacterized protein TRIATDRAFT_302204 [Trichoderma atroviride IMI 206040]EHK41815.1 hypothetical protein TRIATDRAFT_302204 [Trichoderma atroviride IMI 206040]
MNNCWFVLRQSSYTPPKYTTPSRAGGVTVEGDLRLGDVVPSPNNIYPVVTQGKLPRFPIEMRITSTQDCEFHWAIESEREDGGIIGGGAPVAAPIGAALNAEFSAEFKGTMKRWAKFKTLDTEKVQPSRAYIDRVLALPDVKEYIEHHKLPVLNQWTVYVVTGLMIARAGGTIGSCESSLGAVGGGLAVDIPGILNTNTHGSHQRGTKKDMSNEIQGDRIWAVRFAKVHKGMLRRRWMQTEETVGAALGKGDEEGEEIGQVLEHEGIKDAGIVELEMAGAGNKLAFVTGDF